MVGAYRICGPTAANRIPEISDSIVEIDRAMRLGFNWELGPFELWDAAGVEATVARMKDEKASQWQPTWKKLLACGPESLGTATNPKRLRDARISTWPAEIYTAG